MKADVTRSRQAIVPMVVVALSFALWLISDRLLYVGPIDRATFGWLVVVPLWAAAPAFAGLSWRAVADTARTQFAAVGGLTIGASAAVLLWSAVAAPAVGCVPTRTVLELIPPALAVGAVVGGGFFLACRLASGEIAAGRIGRGVTYGATIQVVVIPVASLLAMFAFRGLCQRP
jgi:hypothetical protein